jgi:hypothetical protein
LDFGFYVYVRTHLCHLLNTAQYGLAHQRSDAIGGAIRAIESEPGESLSRQLLQYLESNTELDNFTLELFPPRFFDLREYSGTQRAVQHSEDVRLNKIRMSRQPIAEDGGSLLADVDGNSDSGVSGDEPDEASEANFQNDSEWEDTDEESEDGSS